MDKTINGIIIADVKSFDGVMKSAIKSIDGDLIPSMTTKTWNPSDKGPNVVLSGGNLIANCAVGGWETVRAGVGVTSGKFVFELSGDLSINCGIAGFANSTVDLGSILGVSPLSGGLNVAWSTPGSAGATVSGPNTSFSGFYMFAIDVTAGKAWVASGNVWAQGDPATDTSPTWTWTPGETIYPACSVSLGASIYPNITLVTGEFGFTNTPPAGFTDYFSV